LEQVRQREERSSFGAPMSRRDGSREQEERSRAFRDRPGRVKADVNEIELLRTLVRHPAWLERAVKEVPLEWVETPVLKELYAAMRSRPDDVGSPGFLETLPEAAQRAWTKLATFDAKYGTTDPDQTYVACCQALEVRPLIRELDRLQDRKSRG